ncbi:MAG: hypothetical protein JSU59_07175 [Nitrospirota bacterium]|nr:MAG: hypothetical protein JSU59_07175 [Nitrospirota bacterium]
MSRTSWLKQQKDKKNNEQFLFHRLSKTIDGLKGKYFINNQNYSLQTKNSFKTNNYTKETGSKSKKGLNSAISRQSTDNSMYAVSTQLGTTLLLLIILGVTYGFMLVTTPILRVIGKNGAAILVRAMGMILAALSVELVLAALGLEKWTAVARGFFS